LDIYPTEPTIVTVDAALFYRFAVALGIGMIIGFERERRRGKGVKLFAGVRTFAIIALLGCTAALVSNHTASPAPLVAAFIAVAIMLTVAYYQQVERQQGIGLTTEITALLTILIGALCFYQYITLAAALGIAIVGLLSLKEQLHGFAARITYDELYAALKFALVSLIILPILPDTPLGPPPFDVLNPRDIWWMVVLISGISFVGYILMKVVNVSRGISLSGALGGLVSSTAVTLSFSGRSKETPLLANDFALAILAAWTILFARILIQVWPINRELIDTLWPPMVLALAAGALYGLIIHWRHKGGEAQNVEIANPFTLSTAFKFGALYAVILVVARAAEMYFGNAGIYVSAIISGTVDLSAITATMANLNRSGTVDAQTATNAIVLAAATNTIVKAGIVMTSGTGGLKWRLLPAVPVLIVASALPIWWMLQGQ
jgi:uncharacterized membrane protein (DUF4010 family)